MNRSITTGMKRGTPFEPGNTAGLGRPKGSRNKATLDREALLDEFGAAITRKCLAEALKGEKSAMRLCMERLVPLARHQPVPFKLPAIRLVSDLPRASAAVVKAAADGTLSVQDAEAFQRILEHHRQFLGTHELASRIEALEQKAVSGTALELVPEGQGSLATNLVPAMEEENDAH